MVNAIRRVLIAHVLPRSWALGPDRQARSLQRFSIIEADSAWQFLEALDALEGSRQRARLFLNALEEVHHAALFGDLANKKATRPLLTPPESRSSLLKSPEHMPDFLAYIEIGEHDVYEEFETYAAAGDAESAALFLQIREDEEGHHCDAEALLLELAGSEAAMKKCLRRARLKKAWDAWMRFSQVVGDFFSGIWLRLLYFLVGPIFFLVCRHRLR